MAWARDLYCRIMLLRHSRPQTFFGVISTVGLLGVAVPLHFYIEKKQNENLERFMKGNPRRDDTQSKHVQKMLEELPNKTAMEKIETAYDAMERFMIPADHASSSQQRNRERGRGW